MMAQIDVKGLQRLNTEHRELGMGMGIELCREHLMDKPTNNLVIRIEVGLKHEVNIGSVA